MLPMQTISTRCDSVASCSEGIDMEAEEVRMAAVYAEQAVRWTRAVASPGWAT